MQKNEKNWEKTTAGKTNERMNRIDAQFTDAKWVTRSQSLSCRLRNAKVKFEKEKLWNFYFSFW